MSLVTLIMALLFLLSFVQMHMYVYKIDLIKIRDGWVFVQL